MVRFIITILFLNISFVCIGQNKDILFNAFFSRDSVLMNDTLEVHLYFKNNSNESIKLYPKGITAISHCFEYFIFFESADRMQYILNKVCDYDSIIFLEPQEEFIYKYNITADSIFFYNGENRVDVFYHWFDKSLLYKRRRKNDKREDILLRSPVLNIKVSSRLE